LEPNITKITTEIETNINSKIKDIDNKVMVNATQYDTLLQKNCKY